MAAISLDSIVKEVRDLPPLPSVVIELIESFGRPDIDIATLAEKISQDQALAAKTLRLANSSFYGLSTQVKTVAQAITVLGFDSVRALVAAGGVIDHFQQSGGAVDTAPFWRHSVATALCAKNLARAIKHNQDHAFIAALLHNIGELVMATRYPEQYGQAVEKAYREDIELVKAEYLLFGVDQVRIGITLAQAWKFPSMIQHTIEYHLIPRKEDVRGLAGLTHLANAIVFALDLLGKPDARVPHLLDEVWNGLAIDPKDLRNVFRDTEQQYEEACQILLP